MADEATTTTAAGDGNVTSTTDTTAGDSKTFSQSDVERIVGERLARQRAQFGDVDALKKKAEEYDKLAESQKTETQKLQEERDALKNDATTWQSKALRYEAAAKAGLDLKFAPRLQGSTLEELEADAKQFAEAFGQKTGPTAAQFDGGARQTATDTSFDAMIRRTAGVTG